MDCVYGIVAGLGAVLGTVIGALFGVVAGGPVLPISEVWWLLPVVPVAAVYVGMAIGAAFNTALRRFRPADEHDLLSHDGHGPGKTQPPMSVALVLGVVMLLAPALVAIAIMLVAAELLG